MEVFLSIHKAGLGGASLYRQSTAGKSLDRIIYDRGEYEQQWAAKLLRLGERHPFLAKDLRRATKRAIRSRSN